MIHAPALLTFALRCLNLQLIIAQIFRLLLDLLHSSVNRLIKLMQTLVHLHERIQCSNLEARFVDLERSIITSFSFDLP